MANSIATPFPYFAGLDGDALEGGKIYIGVDGLDAKTNPKAVYYDRAQTELAAQPVRTVSGYPARTGSAAQLFADGAYSISVYTSADVLVFSSLSESGDIAALDAAVSANAADITANAVSIAAVSAGLGTVAVENFTNDNDLSIFPSNVGTRGNAKAYVDAIFASGNYTATVSVLSGSLTTTALTDPLYYYRIGDLVHVSGDISLISKSTPAGPVYFSLPFPADASLGDYGFGVALNQGDAVLNGTIAASGLQVVVGKDASTYTNGDRWRFSFTYRTAS